MSALEVKPGVFLGYLDSGAPDALGGDDDGDYMTVFALHGFTFYTPFFKPASIAAGKYNIRFVAITRRDYPGSSPLPDEDIKAFMEGPTEKRLQVLRERGYEILSFIDQFIRINKIPPISRNGGGFSLLGWSLGNLQGLSALAFANDFPDLVGRLSSYIRSYISFETIPFFPYPMVVYVPLLDESKPAEERGPFFLEWISSHFIQPTEGITSNDIELVNHSAPDPNRPSVFAQLTAEERATMLDLNPPTRSDLPYNTVDQAVNDCILKRAFTQQDNQNLIAWPSVPVKSMYGDQSCSIFLFSQWELEKWRKLHEADAKEKGRWVRTFEATCTPGQSHFFQYEEPDSFVEAVKRLML